MPAVSSKKSQKNAVKPAKKRKMPPPKPVEEEEGSSEESEEEAPAPIAKKGKKVEPPAKKAKKEESESEEESSDEEESEEEAAPVVQKANGKKAAKVAKKESSDEEGSDDEEKEEEEVKAAEADSDDEAEAESSDDEEEGSDDDEEMETKEEVTQTLFIAGLPKEMEEARIVKMFKKKGVELAAIRRPGKKSIVYGDLVQPSQMEVALALNGTEMKGHTVTVEKAKPQKEHVEAKEKNNKKNKAEKSPPKTSPVTPKPALEDKSEVSLFVKNLDWGVTENQLQELFEGCNEVFLPEQDGRKKGFGYVRYSADQSDLMNQHMSELQGSELNGRAIFIDKATPRTPQSGGRGGARGGGRGGGAGGGGGGGFDEGPSKTLIVKSLSFDTTWQSLKDAFEGCAHSRVCTDRESGRSRGFGFVEYDSVDAAQSAMESMNNQDVDGRTVSVNFAADRGSFTPRGGGGGRGGGRGGDRGRGGRGGGGGFRGRGAPRGRGSGFHQASGRKTTFNDSD